MMTLEPAVAAPKSGSKKADTLASSGDYFNVREQVGDWNRVDSLPVCLPAAQRASVKFLELVPPPTVTDFLSFAMEMVFKRGR